MSSTALNIQTDHTLKEREFPILFEEAMPGPIMAEAIRVSNEELAQLPGRAFFPEITRYETLHGVRCRVSYLQADDQAWEAFLRRKVSFMPRVERCLERHDCEPVSAAALAQGA